MGRDELRQQLDELRQTLKEASELSPGERDVLSNLMSDMVKIASGENAEDHEAGNIVGQLEQQATDFEIKHPSLSGVLRQVMDALGKMGI